MKPPKSIFDKTFIYRNAANTDVQATFDRIRREMCNSTTQARNTDRTPQAGSNIKPLRSGK